MSAAEHRIPLGEARKIADGLREIFAPACHRFEVAGSVRRERPTVGDIEIVCIPREGEPLAPQGALFEDKTGARSNLLWEAIEAHSEGHERLMPMKPGVEAVEPDLRWHSKRPMGSKLYKLWLPRRRIAVELWMGTPETWGCLFAIRTGSATFSKALVQRWTEVSKGGHVTNLRMWRAGESGDREGSAPLDSPEEADVFRLCRIAWLEPKDRIDGTSWKAVAA